MAQINEDLEWEAFRSKVNPTAVYVSAFVVAFAIGLAVAVFTR